MRSRQDRVGPRRPPVTTAGRIVAVALVLMGIALVGSITAAVAAWLIRNVEREETPA